MLLMELHRLVRTTTQMRNLYGTFKRVSLRIRRLVTNTWSDCSTARLRMRKGIGQSGQVLVVVRKLPKLIRGLETPVALKDGNMGTARDWDCPGGTLLIRHMRFKMQMEYCP